MKQLTQLELEHITLEDIQRMKSEVHHAIRSQKEDFVRKIQQQTSPYCTLVGGGILGTMRTAYAIFSGITTGIKIMRSIRRMFR